MFVCIILYNMALGQGADRETPHASFDLYIYLYEVIESNSQ